MPKRISLSVIPRGNGPAVTGAIEVAAAALDGPMTLDRLGPATDRSRSASWRSATLQSIRPAVTAALPSLTLRSRTWLRSERSASFAEASRITTANFSTTA